MVKPLLLFYILVIYVLLQFSWWAYLLIELNQEIFEQKIELLELHEAGKRTVDEIKSEQTKELHKRWAMVIGEGAVFLGLLIIGIYITNNSFKKESELARRQRNFLLSITHEFKSPLAAVKLNLQTMQKRVLEPSQQQEVLRKAIMETDRIDILVEKALLAARLEDKSYDLATERLNLSELVHKTVSDHIDRRYPVHSINHIIEPGIYINGDQVALTSLLSNLVENAEKYSPPGTAIEIALSKNNDLVSLTVRDQGIGIDESEVKNVFEKFYRVGNEDTRKSKGTGLGLYIVKNIVHLHKGTVAIRKNLPAGTVFEVTLPSA